MIYIACPYTHSNIDIMEARFKGVQKYLADVLETSNGNIFYYSPIVHCHQLALAHDLPEYTEFWWEYNKAALKVAEALEVVQMPGWNRSTGVAREIGYASAKQIPIYYIEGAEYYNGPELS